MQLDKETLDKLLKLDENTFKNNVNQAIKKSGIKNDKLEKVLGDVSSVKKMLSTMTEADLKKFSLIVSPDKIEDLIKNLQSSVK